VRECSHQPTTGLTRETSLEPEVPKRTDEQQADLGAQADTPQPQRANYVIELVGDL
jgi:hypothetical protein